MAKFHNNTKVLSFRQFDKLDGDVYQTFEIAWPVEVIECYANKATEGMLDALAEAVLELLNIPEMSEKRIAQLLNVAEELVTKIEYDLANRKFYDSQEKKLTKAGLEYIEKKETGEFQEEKVFGNMFVSRIGNDGEVFPYFYEGKLPWARDYSDILYLSFDDEVPSTLQDTDNGLKGKVNRAFHKYGRISKLSRDMEKDYKDYSEIEFIEEELRDRSFNEQETLAEIEEEKNLKNARVKILGTKAKEAYIRCRLHVAKGAPEKFVIDSPFPENITSWYSECFHRLVVNNELIYVEDEEEGLEYFCDDITSSFYAEFPEMQAHNFEQYVKINFPKMLSCSISAICLDKYKEVFRYRNLCEDGDIRRDTVVGEAAKAIELILNNYIAKTDRLNIAGKYLNNVQTEIEINDLFDDFGIGDCMAMRKEKGNLNSGRLNQKNSLLRLWNFKGNRMGASITEKYFYLVAESKYNEKSKFRKLLLTEGANIITLFDEISKARNTYGAHNDGTEAKIMPKAEYDRFDTSFKEVTKLLLEYID